MTDTDSTEPGPPNVGAPPDGIEPPDAERVIEIARELIAFDTSNPPGDTRAITDWIDRFLVDHGVDTERVATDPAKPNLVATIPGASARTLLYNGHADTVPYDVDEWSHDPLGERDGDRLYGRGATDMKGPLAAMLAAVAAIVEADTDPPVTLALAVVSDEETAGDAGVDTLVESGAFDRLGPDACVIGETTCANGRHSVTVADRGSIWLTLRAEGVAAHGSRPSLGENAIDRLWEAVSLLRRRLTARELPVPDGFSPVIEESVAYYEPTLGTTEARRTFTHPTVNLGTIEGGESVNTVPSTATARLDIRLTAGVETAAVLADVRECLSEFPAVSIADASWSVGSYEPADSPLVSAVAETAEGVVASADAAGDGRVFRRSATGGGDAKTLRHAGIPTVEFAFGTDTVHAVDEYTTTTALARNAGVYGRLPWVWADRIGDAGV